MDETVRIDQRAQVDVLRHTTTGELDSWWLGLREPMEVIDGDGEILTFAQGARLLVVDVGGVDAALVERAVDRAELGVHNTYSMRPARTPVRTPFDIRTPASGGRSDDDTPF